ncbi:hypothetical protein CRG98_005857 [Punica granatum]|uniref:Uncharacterized protein n=1 Tax=Punica granatum TaxID=22663 RepID=A0A2I0KZJ7_PUNGR|nr:hypothetical protein CRG98_005857 [Punica granatum]
MTRLSTPTQSLINSLMRLNCPRRFLPQAQCTSKHTIRALHNSLQDKKSKEKRVPRILQTIRTTVDSDFRSFGVRKLQPKFESLVARPGHPQQTTTAHTIEPASGRTTSNRPSSEAGFRVMLFSTAPPLYDNIHKLLGHPRCAWNPKGHLLLDGLMSASYDKIAISNSSERPSRRHLAPSSDKSVSINGPTRPRTRPPTPKLPQLRISLPPLALTLSFTETRNSFFPSSSSARLHRPRQRARSHAREPQLDLSLETRSSRPALSFLPDAQPPESSPFTLCSPFDVNQVDFFFWLSLVQQPRSPARGQQRLGPRPAA